MFKNAFPQMTEAYVYAELQYPRRTRLFNTGLLQFKNDSIYHCCTYMYHTTIYRNSILPKQATGCSA